MIQGSLYLNFYIALKKLGRNSLRTNIQLRNPRKNIDKASPLKTGYIKYEHQKNIYGTTL